MTLLRRFLVGLAALGLVTAVFGCRKASTTTSSDRPGFAPGQPAAQSEFDTESGPFAAGKKVLVANGCFRCHAIDGVRGPVGAGPMAGGPTMGPPPSPGGPPGMGGPGGMMGGRSRGPDLGKVGTDPARTVEWFMAYIRNPRSQKPDAKMPSFEGRLQENDLRALAEYLTSLK